MPSKSLELTPRSRERHKGMQTGRGQVLDGSSRGLNTASMPAYRAQANQWVGKVPKLIPASPRNTPARRLGKAGREWPAGRTEWEIKLLIQENSRPQDLIMYTDGSVTEDQSGWGFTVEQGAAYTVLTSSLTMEVEPVIHVLHWIASRGDRRHTLATKKWKMEWEAQSGMCQWSTSTFENSRGCTALDMPEWKGHDRTDRLAGKATLTSGLHLGRFEVRRSSRHYLQAQSQGHHTIDRLETWGVERGNARRSSFKGRERANVNQTNTGTVSKATLGKLLRDGVGFSECLYTILNWIDLELFSQMIVRQVCKQTTTNKQNADLLWLLLMPSAEFALNKILSHCSHLFHKLTHPDMNSCKDA